MKVIKSELSFFSCLKIDIQRNKGNFKSIYIISFFRVASFFSKRRGNIFFLITGLPIRILYKIFIEWFLTVEIPASVEIGEGFRLQHGQGLVLNSKVRIGKNVTLKHNTTIGASTDMDDHFIAAPLIEDNVIIHPHSIIIGNIKVGNHSIIGAGSVILKDVEPYTIVAGNPGKLIREINKTDD